jgi:sugar phosphate isomerase/epimerase
MASTMTGAFPIGFRRVGSEWQKDLSRLVSWAKTNGFEAIDIATAEPAQVKQITDAGLRVGTADLLAWPDLASPDAGKRSAAAQRNAEYVRSMAALGVRNFFVVIIPEDHARPRKENFGFAVDGYSRVCDAMAGVSARLAIEGWPGGAPYYSSLACTTADYRALLKELPAQAGGINFDPSHLIRVGIDPVRFLGEFAPRVVHVHGKDTELLDDELYEHGNLQPATFASPHGYGAHHWRYTIPGQGAARWSRLLGQLRDAGFDGVVSIELEDERFNGSEDGEKRGFLASRDFLASV